LFLKSVLICQLRGNGYITGGSRTSGPHGERGTESGLCPSRSGTKPPEAEGKAF